MFRQNLKIVLRYLKSHGKYSILNISGLTLGLVLTIMMVMLIHYELSFDAFHPKRDKIYKVCTHDLKSGELQSDSPAPMSLTLKNDFPGIKNVVGVWQTLYKEAEIEYNNLAYSGFSGASVEPDIFSVFDYNLILGKKESVLETETNIAVSQSFSQKLFGSENPVGKTVTIQNFKFTVAGLFEDIPNNSEVQFDVLFSDKLRKVIWDQFPVAWWAGGLQTYVILQDDITIDRFNDRLKQIPDKYYPDFLKGRSTFFAMPLKGLHFNDSLLGGLVPAVSPIYLIILGSIALVTLLIACINFINLSTCQASKRNKDTGIRKIVGAGKNQIISIQLWHSLLSAGIATVLAGPISYILLPWFEKLTQRPISEHFFNPMVFGFIVLLVSLIAFITGIIPGIFYSKISAIKALQLKMNKGAIGNGVRNGFIIVQFSITILLIISQFFILKQISFMRNADLGFNNDNLLAIHVSNIEEDNYNRKYELAETYKNELEKFGALHGFDKGVITENIPGFYYSNSFTVEPVGGKIDECLVTSTAIDENFLEVYEIPMVEGRFFSKKIQSDKWGFIINETLMKQIGWESIDGKFMRFHHEGDDVPVVGVIKDIHTTSLKEAIGPMVYRFGQHNNSPAFLTFRLSEGREKEAIAFMEEKWNAMFPETPFLYFDVKEKYFQNYTEEKRLSKIVGSFALLAIILSSLGLFGLITFFSEQRIKEIGVRKVNGAKITEILALLNKDFVKWVVFAFLIAMPIAWYTMHKWLENFAFKTELSWWVFVLAGGITVILALLTVSWQSFRAANRNPVEALRYE